VNEIGCDILCITGRKYLRGPRGTGLLYVRNTLLNELEPPILDQHAAELISPSNYKIRPDARRFENWEQYFAGKFALCKAIDYSLSWGLDTIQKRVYRLAETLRNKLSRIDGITLTDDGIERCGIVTFMSDKKTPSGIKSYLSRRKINVSTSKGSGSLVSFQNRGLKEVVRASVHYFNTEEEIDYFIDELENLFNR